MCFVPANWGCKVFDALFLNTAITVVSHPHLCARIRVFLLFYADFIIQ